MSSSTIRLLSRTLHDPNIWVWAWNFTEGGGSGFIDYNPFSGEWGIVFPVYHTGTFPFGIPVEPDG